MTKNLNHLSESQYYWGNEHRPYNSKKLETQHSCWIHLGCVNLASIQKEVQVMNRFIVTTFALVVGFFALMLSLLLAIPLAIAAIITGKRIEKQLKRHTFTSKSGYVIEGEYEEKTQAHYR